MPLVVPDAGELRLLGYIVNQLTPTDLVLHLYENDDVDLSTEDFNTSSFTEVSDPSYSSAPLIGADWTISSNAGISSAIYNNPITFNFAGAASVQGYYVTNTNNEIMWAEEFPGAPFTLPSTGGDITVRPQIQLN